MRWSAVLLAALLAARSEAGTVTGQVQLLEKGGARANDLSDVVVYVEGLKAAKTKPVTATIAMKAKSFIPRVVVVPVGGTIEFPNEDPIFHNAFSVSPENRFDLGLYKRSKPVPSASKEALLQSISARYPSWTFKAAGVVNVYCNIHPQMSAVVVVRDSPFFAKASKDGAFTIEGVPAGKYTLVAWHERGGDQAVAITVPAEGQVAANLTLDGSKYRRVQHKNKFGKDYAAGEKY